MKYLIYCDESGESSFSEKSACECFVITALTIEVEKKKALQKALKRKFGKLIDKGWPKDLEIKASILHGIKWEPKIPQELKDLLDGDKYIEEILDLICNSCDPRIDFFAVRKDKILSPYFREAPYGIAYNFFAGKLLIKIIEQLKDCHLIMDQRNKETHNKQRFDDYIKTMLLQTMIDKKDNISLNIDHLDSFKVFGLRAVDFFSWSIYRFVEAKDNRFIKIIESRIKEAIRWYI